MYLRLSPMCVCVCVCMCVYAAGRIAHMAKAYGEHSASQDNSNSKCKSERATICEYELSCKRWLKSEEKLTINSDKEVKGKAA